MLKGFQDSSNLSQLNCRLSIAMLKLVQTHILQVFFCNFQLEILVLACNMTQKPFINQKSFPIHAIFFFENLISNPSILKLSINLNSEGLQKLSNRNIQIQIFF